MSRILGCQVVVLRMEKSPALPARVTPSALEGYNYKITLYALNKTTFITRDEFTQYVRSLEIMNVNEFDLTIVSRVQQKIQSSECCGIKLDRGREFRSICPARIPSRIEDRHLVSRSAKLHDRHRRFGRIARLGPGCRRRLLGLRQEIVRSSIYF